jgi:predicted DNA-binding transcriptional regulator YafY
MRRLIAAIRRTIRVAYTAATALVTTVRGYRYRLLVDLYRAIDNGRPVTIGYRKADGTESERVIEPAELTVSGVGNILLRAYDHRDAENTTFRIDRIVSYTAA